MPRPHPATVRFGDGAQQSGAGCDVLVRAQCAETLSASVALRYVVGRLVGGGGIEQCPAADAGCVGEVVGVTEVGEKIGSVHCADDSSRHVLQRVS